MTFFFSKTVKKIFSGEGKKIIPMTNGNILRSYEVNNNISNVPFLAQTFSYDLNISSEAKIKILFTVLLKKKSHLHLEWPEGE